MKTWVSLSFMRHYIKVLDYTECDELKLFEMHDIRFIYNDPRRKAKTNTSVQLDAIFATMGQLSDYGDDECVVNILDDQAWTTCGTHDESIHGPG